MAARLRLASDPDDVDLDWSAGVPIRVVLAEGHAPMRRSLRGLLDGEEDVEVVGEVSDLASVEREVRLRQPHVLVLDLGMHKGSGIEALSTLCGRVPKTRILTLTMQDDPVFARHALEAGAAGFVSKDLADTELTQAIRAAARGERFVTRRLADRPGARLHESYDRTCPASEDST
jgi:two-component system response regulator NreC